MNKKSRKWLAFLLILSLLAGSIPAWAEEELSPEEVEEEYEEEEQEFTSSEEWAAEEDDYVNPNDVPKEETAQADKEQTQLSDNDAVTQDAKSLDIGFTRCVSRDLRFPTEGKNGTKILWKSSNPKVISDEGKFICPKQITDLTVTATITKGECKKEKKFNITANNRSIYDVLKDYLDTMVEYGRDTELFPEYVYREHLVRVPKMFNSIGKSVVRRGKSGMFFSLLNRDTLQYPTFYVDEWPRMQFNSDERGSGCVTSADIWLYEMMYEISLMTGNKEYERIADDALSFFLEHCGHPESGVLAWGMHTLYDPVIGGVNAPNQYADPDSVEGDAWSDYNEPDAGQRYIMRSPFFMQKFFELNPLSWNKHLMSWWEATIADQTEFSYSRHTHIDGPGSTSGNYASMWNPIAFAYAWGYHYTGDEEYKRAMNSLMNWIERASGWNKNYMYPQEIYYSSNRTRESWMGDTMEATVWFTELLPLVPEDIRERMQRYIDKITNDVMVCDPSQGKNCFGRYYSIRTGQVSSYRSLLDASAYYKRWIQLPEGEQKDKFGKWVLDWTDKYAFTPLENMLSSTEFTAESIIAEVNLHLALYKETGIDKYLDRVLEIADFAIYDFWEMESLLPAMSHVQKKYYESTQGAPQLAKLMWDAYFLDIERKTGVNPQMQAWENAGYFGKDMNYVTEDKDFFQKTRYDSKKEEVPNEE